MASIKKMISVMTLKEKISLMRGFDIWHTISIDRLGIPSLLLTDGPNGIRCENPEADAVDKINMHGSYPATCFPSESLLASTFNCELMREIGIQLAKEAQYFGVNILLGPGINHKRMPVGGRNFEYFSEDPVLTSELAAAYIEGVQSQGIGCCIKHFFANNTEYMRNSIDIKMDRRPMYEIYLKAFNKTINKAKPLAVMSAYNKIFGDYCSESVFALQTLLRGYIGFNGVVISDWGAVHDKVKSVLAGCDIEMTVDYSNTEGAIEKAVANNELSEDIIDKSIERILKMHKKLSFKAQKANAGVFSDSYDLCLKAALEGMVLLKNEEMLPLADNDDFCIIGAAAEYPRIQGDGSARVNYNKNTIPLYELERIYGKIKYAAGYDFSGENNDRLLEDAIRLAKSTKKVVLFISNDNYSEQEGEDRKNLSVGDKYLRLIDGVTKVNENAIVVLQVGGVIEMPFINKVKAVLLQGFGGSAGGEAVAKILSGKVSPSGRLSETFPVKYTDNPSYPYYAYDEKIMEYKEGIMTGYRYYNTYEKEVLFPFGFGLSYTEFIYDNYTANIAGKNIEIKVKITNVGKMVGKETLMVYFSKPDSKIKRAKKELLAFKKIHLNPQQSGECLFVILKKDLSYWDDKIRGWKIEKGKYILSFYDFKQKPIKTIEITL